MTLAMKRLKNIGWLALVFLVLIMLYPLSLHVASMHSDLVSVDHKIMATKREISFLQAELRTRASMQQLEEWNELLYGYQPPTAAQFLEGEAELASIGGSSPVAKPVMVAVSSSDGVAPAGIIGSVFARMPSAVVERDQTKNTEKSDEKQAADKQKDGRAEQAPTPAPQTRTEKLAQIDQKLLSDDLMKEIEKKSVQERKKR
jgi:hypothetical protein